MVERWGRPPPICNVSGEVSGYARQGIQLLNMTRALGDISFDKTGISQDPTVSIMYLSPEQNGLLVVASDGMWNGVHLTHEKKMASSYSQFLCLTELLNKSDSINSFGKNVFEQIRSFFGEYYDDIAIGIQNVPTHAECLATHLAAVPESRAMPSGVPCKVLHVYDYDPENYARDIEEQFPAPVEEVAAPVEKEVIEIFRPKECDQQCFLCPSNLGYISIKRTSSDWRRFELDWCSLDMSRLFRIIPSKNFKLITPEAVCILTDKYPVLTIEDVIGPTSKAVKHKRQRQNYKQTYIRTFLPKGKYGAFYRVNQPRERVNQPRK
ncbi:MAG: hypothetical protein EBY22_17320 [Gammaproteobacteria bacterium]|nr:hypothetical protein [Gammaproteobacteria bacterium]